MSASKFEQPARLKIVAAVGAGVSLADAARAADISPETLRGWVRRGRREPSGAYRDFADAIEEARAEAQGRAAEVMDKDELGRVAARAARRGSVQAMKLIWEMLKAEPDEPTDDPFDFAGSDQ